MNPQTRASDEDQDAAAKKNVLGSGGQTREEGAEPRERNARRSPREREVTQVSSDNAAPKSGVVSRIKNFGRENKLIATAVPVLALLITAVGAISDFSVLVGLWSDEKASNTRPYIGIDVKDYAPVVSSFGCVEGDADCLRASENADLKSRLREGGALRVVEVAPNGPAAEAGVQTGDIVTGIDGFHLAGSAEFSRIMEEYHPGDTVRLSLYREGEEKYLERESVQVELK